MIYSTNEKARFDYEILETFEAGLVLLGHEAKSVRKGKISIKGVYVKIIGGNAYLIGAIISPYQTGNTPTGYDPQRNRRLLLKKSQLKYLVGKTQEAGLALVPLKVYDKHGMIKIEIGLGRGKKKFDKREVIKKRETKRLIQRKLKIE